MLTFSPHLNITLSMKTSSSHYSLPTILMQPALPTIITPTSGPSDKLAQITSTLFLNTTEVATIKADPLVILTINEDIKEYHWELK
jgi:hypothetical protein